MEHNFEMKTGLDTAAMDSATVDKRPKQWHPLPQFNKTKEKSYLWAMQIRNLQWCFLFYPFKKEKKDKSQYDQTHGYTGKNSVRGRLERVACTL